MLKPFCARHLEAYVDLINLASDATYIDYMLADYHKQWIKLAEVGVKGKNPYLASFHNNEDASGLLADHVEALKTLPAPLNAFEKFKRAGMTDEYRSVYNSLCNESHNNIRALTSRHFRMVGEDKVDLIIFDDLDKNTLATALDGFIAILNGSNYIIHDYFKTDAQTEVAEFQKRREKKGPIWEGEARA